MAFNSLGMPTFNGFSIVVDSSNDLVLRHSRAQAGARCFNSSGLLFQSDSLVGSLPGEPSVHDGLLAVESRRLILENIVANGATGFGYADGGATDGADGIRLVQCDSVEIRGSEFVGGNGGLNSFFGVSCGNGGDGLDLAQSVVHLFSGTFRSGHEGNWPDSCAFSHDGKGVSVDSSSIVTIDSSVIIDHVDDRWGVIPQSFVLYQNYPNPFNPATTITYFLPSRGFVNLTIFNAFGQKIESLVAHQEDAGSHTVRWNARSRPSGVYYSRLETRWGSSVKNMLLLK